MRKASEDMKEEPLPNPGQRRILLVKFGAIGDCLMALGGVSRLLREDPQVELTWLVGRSVEPLIQYAGLPIQTVPVDLDNLYGKRGLVPRLREILKLILWGRGKHYDLVFVAYRSPLYRWILGPFLGAGKWRSFREEKDLQTGKYHADEYYRNLRPTPAATLTEGTELAAIPFPRAQTREKAVDVFLAPGAAKNKLADDGLRRWPIAHYVKLGEKLLQKGLRVMLVGGPEDLWVQPHFAHLPVEDRIHQTSLVELLDLLRSGRVLVAHDSGPMHLGFAAGIATLALFGPTQASEKIPASQVEASVLERPELTCRPCYNGRTYAACEANLCLKEISVEEVLKRVEDLLAE
jgi:heptosyltransferase-2